MRSLYFLFFLCLLLAAGRESAAQNPCNSPQKAVIERSYTITAPVMSEDGNWLALRKRSWLPARKKSDLDKDTVILFDLRKPGESKIAGLRQSVRDLAFVGNSRLLLSNDLQTELLDLKEQTSIYFTEVRRLEVLKSREQFVLHYREAQKSLLELRDADGKLLNARDHVSRFYTTKDDQIYAVTENDKNGFDILRIGELTTEKLYHADRKISSLDIDPGQTGMMIHEQNPENNSENILYLDLKTKNAFPLNEVLSTSFLWGFTEVIQEGNVYFLKVWGHRQQKDSSIVDIWYSNDNRLEEKFYPPDHALTYVWEPRNRVIRRVGTDHLPVSINTGNDRYFLSFDPYRLQDYQTEQPPLQLFVYDLSEDRYALLDTIAPELYLSGNGDYALSPATGESRWSLYHIPSKSKKLIVGKALGTPWFTTDGKSVVFEGEGAVWQYQINTATLTALISFDGYQTRIVNGQWNNIAARKGTFVKHQVNLSQPLVIELYDPGKNRTGYTLWYNGKTQVICPPMTKRIQSLNYNQSFTCFCWLKEDYNLPPRLVFKELDKEDEKKKETETVVYQSNQQDKAILSLKREIISYRNSDAVPLKGILYYPLGYDPSRKYPMVVHIYEKQNQLANQYLHSSYYESLGFNIRRFLEKGYFVYLPDIVIQGKAGPGMDALDCVNRALDALAHNLLIDKSRIGLIGHSFGGYETDYIATRSTRFAAFVAGSGHSDIVRDANSFNYNFYFPDYVRIEANQYKFGVPFSADKSLYFKNNPVYHAEKVNAPVLLWTGTKDQNVTPDHTMAFYNALRRNGKDVIALFYKGEGHSLQQKPAQVDLTGRILNWFDYFLKRNKQASWIKKGINKKNAH